MTAVDTDFLSLDLVHVLYLPLRQEALLRRRLVHLYVRKVQLPRIQVLRRIDQLILHALEAGDIRRLDRVTLMHCRLDAVARALALSLLLRIRSLLFCFACALCRRSFLSLLLRIRLATRKPLR